mmetsp:Transcript_18605/g.26183  ORF Transcript_18605/g.26183 Transcript_18605/m.26183 type:complete len:99 (-) Transcript_18605:51-347(-)
MLKQQLFEHIQNSSLYVLKLGARANNHLCNHHPRFFIFFPSSERWCASGGSFPSNGSGPPPCLIAKQSENTTFFITSLVYDKKNVGSFEGQFEGVVVI